MHQSNASKGTPSQPEFTKILQKISFGTDSETVSLDHVQVKIALASSLKNPGFSTHGWDIDATRERKNTDMSTPIREKQTPLPK